MTYKVFGHKNPDTDTICSAIIAAWYYTEILSLPAQAYRLGELNKETEYVLKTFGIDTPPLLGALSEGEPVIIVDTNNAEELPDDIKKASIVALYDHHKLYGNLTSATPMDLTIRPLASTASVLAEMGLMDYEVPKYIAQLIIACVISDTLHFRSPTTTEDDKGIVSELCHEHGISAESLAEGMFAAKSDVSDLSPAEILNYDAKRSTLNGKTFHVAVMETTNPESILEQKLQLKSALLELKAQEGLDYVLFYAIDIIKEEAYALACNGDALEINKHAFEAKFENDIALLPGVLSRKKQIIPALEEAA